MVAHKKLAQGFLVQVIARGNDIRAHDFSDQLVSRSDDEITKRDNSQQTLLWINDVDVVDCFFSMACVPAKVTDRLVHRHVGPKPGIAGVHQPARFILRIVEEDEAGGLMNTRYSRRSEEHT